MSELSIDELRKMCQSNKMRWTNHVFLRLLQRNISMEDVQNVIMNGEIIEQYPNDYPHPSCLILGLSIKKQYIHVVCGLSPVELCFITAYYPDTEEWSNDFKMRKEN